MAIECCRTGEAGVWWEQWRWPKLLRLAEAHSWRPQGTSQPPEEQADYPGGRWDGNYLSNDCQTVAAEDAAALADALERALPHVPDHDALARYALPSGGIEITPNHPPAPDADWFSGGNKPLLREFIEFCRRAAFRIC